MNRHVHLMLLATLSLWTGCAQAPERPTQVEDQGLLITLSTPRTTYLLGEPITLELLLVNNAGHSIIVPDDHNFGGERDIGFYISLGGKQFKRVPRQKETGDDTWSLRPGEVYKYDIDILGDRFSSEENQWYFAKPSPYFIQVFFPVDRKREVRSNVVEFCVKEPIDPVDVKVWNQLKSWDFKHFLQTGCPVELADIAKTLELYETYPTSSFRPAFRHALIKSMRNWHAISDSDRERLMNALGMRHEMDVRLEKNVTKGVGFPLMIQQALDMHSEESGVPLSADPRYVHVHVQTGGSRQEVVPIGLGSCMADIRRRTDGIWVPRGDGYHLTRDE